VFLSVRLELLFLEENDVSQCNPLWLDAIGSTFYIISDVLLGENIKEVNAITYIL
jgi:hypothetical protein